MAITDLEAMCARSDGDLDVRGVAARLESARRPAVVVPLRDVLLIEKAIGRLLSVGWSGPTGNRTVHRLLYDLARCADHDGGTADRLLRHALEFPDSPLQVRVTRRRLRRVRRFQRARES
jgi:hypothetical protein